MSPARAGSFNANFSPETLESFKSLCRDQSKQYTKVLERLAELYLGSQGQILDNLSESPELELNQGYRRPGKIKAIRRTIGDDDIHPSRGFQ